MNNHMASAENPAPPRAATAELLPRAAWPGLPALLWFGLLLLAAYLPVLIRLASDWIEDENMGHGFFVPVVAGWIAWQRRQELNDTPIKPNYWGLLLVGWGTVQLIVATLGAEFFLARSAFLISLVGVILTLCGVAILKVLAFPLLLLVFMIPLPSLIYNQITFPLQLFASRMAEISLSAIGIPVLRHGNVLDLPSQSLSVVEACSGIRSLLSLTFLSLVYAHFFDTRAWMKVALFLATIPIAVAANSFRVSLTGALSEYDPQLAEGLFHTFEGWVIFLFAFAALIITHRLISWIAGRKKHGVLA